MIKKQSRNSLRLKRHLRIRKTLSGTQTKPRLSVFRSNKFIYVQVIDDTTGTTLVSATTQEKTMPATITNKKSVKAATIIGETIAKRAIEKGIDTVVFDRSGYAYHGKVKALADAARAAGLNF